MTLPEIIAEARRLLAKKENIAREITGTGYTVYKLSDHLEAQDRFAHFLAAYANDLLHAAEKSAKEAE